MRLIDLMATLLVRSHRIPCLELDLLVSVLADLMLTEVFEKLCRLASKGHILFALIGIPCKTWSVARVGSVSHPFQLRGRAPESVHYGGWRSCASRTLKESLWRVAAPFQLLPKARWLRTLTL